MTDKRTLHTLAACCAIVLACALAYSNSLDTPFILDDTANISGNQAIRGIWPPWKALTTPFERGDSVAGRPLVQLTLAANFALNGLNVRGYHLFNTAVHILSALFLFGLVRRTLALESLCATFGKARTLLAAFCAAAWALHPLNTQAVTYVIQRSESLMGLFFLAALYCALIGWQSGKRRTWHFLALLSYVMGLGSKEVIVVLPLVVFLYDYVFIHKNAEKALSKSKLLYIGLVMGLIPLGLIAAMAGLGQARTGPLPYGPSEYLLTQFEVVWHYIRLGFWPSDLCLDYGPWVRGENRIVLIKALALLSLMLLSLWKCLQKRPAGFLGTAFFLVLAPTSSALPLADTAFEHRMYLSLACLVVLLVCGLYSNGRNLAEKHPNAARPLAFTGLALGLSLLLALGVRTHMRNHDYESRLRIWMDTAARRPHNARAHLNLGNALARAGRHGPAMQSFQRAAALLPQYGLAWFNMASIWHKKGLFGLAKKTYETALFFDPGLVQARVNLGTLQVEQGLLNQARKTFREAIQHAPFSEKALMNLGYVEEMLGNTALAMKSWEKALELVPDYPEAHFNLAYVKERRGLYDQAVEHYAKALKRAGAPEIVHLNLGNTFLKMELPHLAARHYEEALAIRPDYAGAHLNLALALDRLGHGKKALAHAKKALELEPKNQAARAFIAQHGQGEKQPPY